jgi:hypothetical protein
MADVFEILRADHAEYEKLFAALEESLDSVDANDDLMAARASVVQWLSRDYARAPGRRKRVHLALGQAACAEWQPTR